MHCRVEVDRLRISTVDFIKQPFEKVDAFAAIDECGMPGTRLSDAARDALERLYAANPFPDTAARLALANEVNIDARQVQVWFQNKRQRVRIQKNAPAVQSRATSGVVNNDSTQCTSSVEQRRALVRTRSTSSQQHGIEQQLAGHFNQIVRSRLGVSIETPIAKPQAWKQHGISMDALDVLALSLIHI